MVTISDKFLQTRMLFRLYPLLIFFFYGKQLHICHNLISFNMINIVYGKHTVSSLSIIIVKNRFAKGNSVEKTMSNKVVIKVMNILCFP